MYLLMELEEWRDQDRLLFEHYGDNRSGKTLLNAFFAWVAYNRGQEVFCNCPFNYMNGHYNCILNFPHTHIGTGQFFDRELYNCYIMTDQGETSGMDSFNANTKEAKETVYFGLQATKLGVDWHYDTVRHKSILNRVRLNAHFYIHTLRIPPDPRERLQAIKIKIMDRYSDKEKTWYMIKPQLFFPLFNSEVLIRPSVAPVIDEKQIYKQIVGK